MNNVYLLNNTNPLFIELTNFLRVFYDFQIKMNITKHMCIQNSVHLQKELRKLKIHVQIVSGIFLRDDQYSSHCWIAYRDFIIEPNFHLYIARNNARYFINGVNAYQNVSKKKQADYQQDLKIFQRSVIKTTWCYKQEPDKHYMYALTTRNLTSERTIKGLKAIKAKNQEEFRSI